MFSLFTRKKPLSSNPNVRSGNSSGNGSFVGSRSNAPVRSNRNGVNSKVLNSYAKFNPKVIAANAAAAKKMISHPTFLQQLYRAYQKEINEIEEDIQKLEQNLAKPKSASGNSQEDLMWGFLALRTEDKLSEYEGLKAIGEKKLDAIKTLMQNSQVDPDNPDYPDLKGAYEIIQPDLTRYLAANPAAAAGGSRRRSTTRRRRRR